MIRNRSSRSLIFGCLISGLLPCMLFGWSAPDSLNAQVDRSAIKPDPSAGNSVQAFQTEEKDILAEDLDVANLVSNLGSASFKVRKAAQDQLMKLGPSDLPDLRKALAEQTHPEIRWRIKSAIKNISSPRWRLKIPDALSEAKSENKMLMVFSTIGEVQGFS